MLIHYIDLLPAEGMTEYDKIRVEPVMLIDLGSSIKKEILELECESRQEGSIHSSQITPAQREANIINLTTVNIRTEGLEKPTLLRGISGRELRSLGSDVIDLRAFINGKPIREVKSTFEYCHLGCMGYNGILGMPGIKALRLSLNHDGKIKSELEQGGEVTKSAFLSSLQATEVPETPPKIPLSRIRTGEDVLRAFSHCFCNDISDMDSGATIVASKLRMLSDNPVYRRQYPIPNKLISKVKALVDELEDSGIIEGSTSLWNSPLFPVAKTDGSVRITMDLRMINEATEFFPFPIPRVEDNLRAFAGAKVFSTLDLTSGFFQIHIPESDRNYFTFLLHWGRYRFIRLPQGAKNSAQIFQWAMNLVLGDLLYKCVHFTSMTSLFTEQHVTDLAAVLERLSCFNLKAKRGKSYSFKGSVDYLSQVIDQGGIKPMWDNVAALRNLNRPHNIRGIRSLLGTVNYYRRFMISNLGQRMRSKKRSRSFEYVKTRNKYTSIINNKKKKYFCEIQEKLNNTYDSSEFWKTIARFRKRNYTQGNISISDWQQFYNKLLDTESIPDYEPVTMTFLNTDNELTKCITLNEISKEISRIRHGKAAVIQPIFKNGDPDDPSNYRGIALLSNIAKLFISILKSRLGSWIERRNIVPENQAGFRAGHSCQDHIFTLLSLIQMTLSRKRRKCYMFFVDLKKAFATVPHSLLWRKQVDAGLNHRFVNLIKDHYTNMTAALHTQRRCTAAANWDNTLPMVAFAIRTTVHASTGFTPAKLVFGHELRLPQPFQEEEHT
ncbi:hypothetical protein LAZ67_3005181 [Cordylochernes scorpioides]|uniref:Reverse transcriptase domain-containing protein n=1 Tax=Cordylochernes scorpioides TaxID=51811 RepID=A0ABY6KBX5_9ARAC|nr:hypothetical protein LAZ67_3005181 [Cordylochernes scorpioides]